MNLGLRSEIATNSEGYTNEVTKILRQTYLLLALTLGVSAIAAFVSYSLKLPSPHWAITLVVFYGLLFLIHKFQDSSLSLAFTFLLTTAMGAGLGPILSSVLSLENGASIVGNAFFMTAFAFLGLSLYVTKTKKDMGFLSGFLMAGFFVLMAAVIANLVFGISGLGLAISVGFVIFSCAAILFQTSEIVKGGERNYVLATVGLYISIYNLFVSLMHIFGIMSSDD